MVLFRESKVANYESVHLINMGVAGKFVDYNVVNERNQKILSSTDCLRLSTIYIKFRYFCD